MFHTKTLQQDLGYHIPVPPMLILTKDPTHTSTDPQLPAWRFLQCLFGCHTGSRAGISHCWKHFLTSFSLSNIIPWEQQHFVGVSRAWSG